LSVLSVAVIVGDNYCAGLSTICSLINQSRAPDQLVVFENPLRGKRLSAHFDQLTSLLAWADGRGVACSLVSTQSTPLTSARERCEQHLYGDMLMISDGDHFYPHDYLEEAERALLQGGRGFFGGAVESPSSVNGLDAGQALALVKDAPDYVAGGAFVYSGDLRSLWKEVKGYTEGYGEDRCWRALCYRAGGVRLGIYERSTIAHLSMHDSAKYPDLMRSDLIDMCNAHLGAVKRVEF
jgi:hypothetical protein